MDFRIDRFEVLPEDLKEFYHRESQRIFNDSNRTKLEAQKVRDGKLRAKADLNYLVAFCDNDPIGAILLLTTPAHFEGELIKVGIISGVFVLEKYRGHEFGVALTNRGREYAAQISDVVFGYGKEGRRDEFIKMPYYVYLGASGRVYVDTDGVIAPGRDKKIFSKIKRGSVLLLEHGRA